MCIYKYTGLIVVIFILCYEWPFVFLIIFLRQIVNNQARMNVIVINYALVHCLSKLKLFTFNISTLNTNCNTFDTLSNNIILVMSFNMFLIMILVCYNVCSVLWCVLSYFSIFLFFLTNREQIRLEVSIILCRAILTYNYIRVFST